MATDIMTGSQTFTKAASDTLQSRSKTPGKTPQVDVDRQQTVDLFELLDQADLSRAQEPEVLPKALGDLVRPIEPALPDRTG